MELSIMIFHDGVNLSQVIMDVNTGVHWSGSPRAYELFGKDLLSYKKFTTGVDWITLIYSKKYPNEIFMRINVEWSSSDWITAKSLISKQIEFQNLNDKRAKLAELGITDNESDADRLELQTRFINSLEQCNGMLMKACGMSEVPIGTYRSWMQTDQDFAQAVMEIRELIKDEVEGKLISNAKKGDGFAIKYFLDSRARDRGYGKESGEKVEEQEELDLSKLSYEEQDILHKLILKAQPNQKPQTLRIG